MEKKIDTWVIIPARGNSKELKFKNYLKINNKPLIYYTIDFAKKIGVSNIILSSENKKILSYALSQKITIHKRSKNLSNDNVHASKVVLQCISDFKIPLNDIVIMLLPTFPIRDITVFKKKIFEFKKSKFKSLIGIKWLGVYQNNLRYIEKGKLIAKDISLTQRQMARKVYSVDGSIFASKVKNLLNHKSFHYKKNVMFIKNNFGVDLNTKEDLKILKKSMKKTLGFF